MAPFVAQFTVTRPLLNSGALRPTKTSSMKKRNVLGTVSSSALRQFAVGMPHSQAVSALAQSPSTISIRAARVLDGRGGVVENGVIEITGSKITTLRNARGR